MTLDPDLADLVKAMARAAASRDIAAARLAAGACNTEGQKARPGTRPDHPAGKPR